MTKRTKPVFTVGGKPVIRQILPVSVERVMAWLDGQKFGEMFTDKEIITSVGGSGSSPSALRRYRAEGRYDGYWVHYAGSDSIGRKIKQSLWGSKETIAAFKEEVGE